MPKESQTKLHQIRITKSKFIHVQIPVQNGKKRKYWENFGGLQNRTIRGL